jgi:hypothetical protein
VLFESKLDKFILKRAAVLVIILTAADIAFLGGNRWFVLGGLLLGTVVSLGRMLSNEWILKVTFKVSKGKALAGSIAAFTINQLALVPIILLAYFLNIWLFCGLIAGFLVVPAIVMMNSITEAFGITKNSFE